MILEAPFTRIARMFSLKTETFENEFESGEFSKGRRVKTETFENSATSIVCCVGRVEIQIEI